AERLGDAVAVDDVRELLAAAGVVREVRGAGVLEAGEGGALREELAGGVAGGLGAVRVSGDGVHGVPPRRVDPGPSRLRCYDLTSESRGSLVREGDLRLPPGVGQQSPGASRSWIRRARRTAIPATVSGRGEEGSIGSPPAACARIFASA